ncbi:mucin-12 isoform X4 [Cryptotermes secundus]|uniref:mucin-12 isoform X4 n=1 Tax=Cryptotermes secundus TaxID=105785 RepID=UPI000CD7BF88|nr:mucin-12 isoform X4 [Cryptotermes secundus]
MGDEPRTRNASGSGRDPTENLYQPLEPSFYSRLPLQPGSSQYEQQQHQYGYYPVNQGNPGSSSTYSDQQQRTFSPSYSQQQQQQQPTPHYAPHSPSSPVTSAGSYHYNSRLSSPSGSPVSAPQHHGMNYSNPQQQALYSSALSPGHYGSPNHGQHSGYSPSSSNSSGGGGGSGNSQQWQIQQSAGDFSQHHSSPSPQHSSVLTGSPSASSATTQSPSPAHTPTPTGTLHSPPSSIAMSGQYPAHHHGRHPPMGTPPQTSQGHNLPSWVHHGAGPGMSMHSGTAMSGPPPQGPGYYPPPHPGRGIQGPPQHAHMASCVPVSGDRRSPLLSPTPGSWNNLGSVASAAAKASGTHDGSGRGPPPPSTHPQKNNGGSTGGGSGNPLFSLQMLVNQDINRNAAASSASVAQANSYRASTPSATHQQETVDLSSAGSGVEVYSRMLPQQSGPIPLTCADKQTTQVPEHASLRNGSIITCTSAASSVVSNTNVTSPPTPLNGEVSSDSGIGSSATPTPSSQAEMPISSTATPSTDINKSKTLAPVVESKACTKETVSVIAQTPPREKPKVSPPIPATSPHHSNEGKPESPAEECESGDVKDDSRDTDKALATQEPERSVKPASEEHFERCNPVIMSSTTDMVPAPREPTSNVVSSSNDSSLSKPTDDGLSVPSPSPGSKDSTSPVRSPKSGNMKRMKKVDSILENLVESGTKKFGGGNTTTVVAEQPSQTPSTTTVVVAPASVIVSPAATSEDSSSGLGQDVRTPSPGSQQKQQPTNRHKSPVPMHEEDAVSPTSGGADDSENGKPRRKRKLDKPVRVSKVSGEGEVEKEAGVDGDVGKDESQKLEEGPPTDESNETKELAAVECATSSKSVEQETCTKPIEAVTVDVVSSQDLVEKQEPSRRRRSSESSAASPSPVWPAAAQRTRRKSASDQQEDNGSSNAGDLLSVLVSNQHDKNVIGDSKPEVKNAFIEVETELEKMFAGIVEPEECVDPLKLDTASPVPMDVSPSSKTLDSLTNNDSASAEPKPASSMKSRGRPKGSRNGTRRSSESIFGTASTDSTPEKKKKKQSKRSADDPLSSTLLQKKTKKTKLFQGESGNDSSVCRKRGLIKGESACRDGPLQPMSVYDSSSNTSSSRSRGPLVHIEGPKDNPYHVSVVNAPFRGEDEDGGERGGIKKQPATASRRKIPSYHNDLDYRGKVTGSGGNASGMFSSTLSARYDAHTTDLTWICVFCKKGPHCSVGGGGTSGDLFGPYLLTPPDKLDMNGEGSADERDITEEQKRSGGRNKRSLREAHMVEQFCQKMSRKVQRSHTIESSSVAGMVPVSSSSGDGKEGDCYEVWVHEDCAVWAAGVHVVGSRIVGLQEAVWNAVHTVCNKCGEGGANVSCVRRGCEWRLHYGCAREQGWELDEEAYITRCVQHKKGVFSSEEAILPT